MTSSIAASPNQPRLKKRADFLRVKDAGQAASRPGLVLQVAPLPPQPAMPSLRYGLTASRRVGGAVERNRARRRLRALADSYLPLYARPGYDYVLIARPATVSRAWPLLQADLLAALDRVGLRRAPEVDRSHAT